MARDHVHPPLVRATPAEPTISLLRLSAAQRLLWALALVAGLWALVLPLVA